MKSSSFTLLLRTYKTLKTYGALTKKELFSTKYGTQTNKSTKRNIINFFTYTGLIIEVKNNQGIKKVKLRRW